MKKIKVLWVVSPLQGLAESLLVGLAILGLSSRLEGNVESFVFQTATFFLCGSCGMWAVLRIRIPHGGWLRQIGWELAVGGSLSLMMLAGLQTAARLLGWDAMLRLAGGASDWQNPLLLGCTGLGYCMVRIGVRLWLRWDQMRRKRMLWSLTHAHLTVVVFFALLAALVVFILAPYSSTAMKTWSQTQDPLASVVTGLLVTFFPVVTLIIIATAGALVVMLPPLALFSYWVARRTTRRLEVLAGTTAALRSGDYRARVPVEGEDEVARLQADFNAMAEKLEATLSELKAERDTVAQVLQARRDLVANVSHELRTPVATLHAALETALRQWDETPSAPPTEVRQNLEVMDAEILRLSGLIDDLFTLAQADVNNLPLLCAPTDLAPLIQQAVDSFARLAWNAGRVEVTASLPAGLPSVLADAHRLQQVLLNLLRNGARHTPPGGIVAILAEAEVETVRIEVRDTGEGIDPDDLPHIWERFYRGKNATPESAGLGLALVKELVEAMGGSVGVTSTPGQGSCFILYLKKA